MNDYPIRSPRKLIEVALPLDSINLACEKEKSIRHGHPSTLHVWFARRPLVAARAVIFAQMVNDPGYQQGGGFKYGKNIKEAAIERKRLFKIIEELVLWENTTNEEVLERARVEIRRSWREVCELNKEHPLAKELFNPDKLPALHDPFAGGGAIPLEAQRLGLEAFASDLNPVAVLINKAMIEIPPKFSCRQPINPEWQNAFAVQKIGKEWQGSAGLAEDLRYYGAWMCEEAKKRVGNLYPPIEITEEIANNRPDLKPLIGQKLKVIAWIWTRTVKSPSPSHSSVYVPLVKSFKLTTKKGKNVWIEPVISNDGYTFEVRTTKLPEGFIDGTVSRKGAVCIMSKTPIDFKYIRQESKNGNLRPRLMAIVAEGKKGRVFLSPDSEHERIAQTVVAERFSELEITHWPGNTNVVIYGLDRFLDLFTPRQLKTLTLFSDLVSEVSDKAFHDAIRSGMKNDGKGLDNGGIQAKAYADSIATYLGLAVSKTTNRSCALAPWMPSVECPGHLFSRHAIPMNWDFAESNIVGGPSGSFSSMLENTIIALEQCGAVHGQLGTAFQHDAQTLDYSNNRVISTDPPYYDNIPYSELSDFFYVWLRRSLQKYYPNLFTTLAVPKAEELVANAQRLGSPEAAEDFFLDGMTKAINQMAEKGHPAFPVTIYYAFKQSETESEGTVSSGWVAFLDAVVRAGFEICGTWPMRTERESRSVGIGSNALASSIILVCRKRSKNAQSISRRDFIRELNIVLPQALDEMTKGAGDEQSPVAPVDLSQAIIGPGMAVFTKYASVLEADGSPMSVRTVLQLINRFLAEDDFDADTQFCLSWFEQNSWKDGTFGDADTLARGKGISVDGVKDSGVIQSGGGKVRLLKWLEYPANWDPLTDNRTPIWEALHHLIRALKRDGGEAASGVLLAALGGKAEAIRQLAYRLYTLCERLGQAEDARAYNDLITSWTGIETTAAAAPKPSDGQLPGFENT